MKKTAAWLVRYGLEQLGVRFTFGIPGVHNTEMYDELNNSELVTPVLVTHEGCGAFMADAISRTSQSVGTLLIVPAAGVTHAASGIGEAFLDGIPMLVISGGIRSDSEYEYQLHDIDQHALLKPITKRTFMIEHQNEVLETLYRAYDIAAGGEPGPVFIEVPVNLQLYTAEIDGLLTYDEYRQRNKVAGTGFSEEQIDTAAEVLCTASSPGLFLGWGSIDVVDAAVDIAEALGAPASTTLQGLSAFPANHPLHTGMSFGPHAVPAATEAFNECDAMLAVGTRFGEIATGSYGIAVPENLVHIDINPSVLNANYPAKVAIEGDARVILPALRDRIVERAKNNDARHLAVAKQIADDKTAYRESWYSHESRGRVNPARFFDGLRESLADDGIVVVDDGNHTFLVAELMPIHGARGVISPTDFNCMGYAVPATIGAKLVNPDKQVAGVIGDGAFMMTCMEIVTAANRGIGALFIVFNDGELSQISQAQEVPYNRKTCSVLGTVNFEGVAMATGAEYVRMTSDGDIAAGLAAAWATAGEGRPVVVDVMIDYSKATRFTEGAVGTNIKRLPANAKIRMFSRALLRKVTG